VIIIIIAMKSQSHFSSRGCFPLCAKSRKGHSTYYSNTVTLLVNTDPSLPSLICSCYGSSSTWITLVQSTKFTTLLMHFSSSRRATPSK